MTPEMKSHGPNAHCPHRNRGHRNWHGTWPNCSGFSALHPVAHGKCADNEGTGLRLPLTKLLIQAMNGSIAVESEAGICTCVTVTLCGAAATDVAQAA